MLFCPMRDIPSFAFDLLSPSFHCFPLMVYHQLYGSGRLIDGFFSISSSTLNQIKLEKKIIHSRSKNVATIDR